MGEIDFLVLKINGVSVQHFSEDEAVQSFLKSSDPIQIEVQQLQTTLNSSDTCSDRIRSASLVLTLRCLTISSSNCVRSTQTQETQTSDFSKYKIDGFNGAESDATASIVAANNERLIEEEHVIFDQCLAPEIDIEEVTLRKSTSNELLGLSIIYSGADSGSKTNSGGSNNGGSSAFENNNDVCTEVYISHIQKDSVAGRDGRLRQGDQILQINGKDIKTKEETETLIAENNNAVTLLVSRYLYTDEDDFNDPSLVVGLEVEEVGDENDETDEEEGDDLYVDNNSAYENCLVANDNMHLVNNLDRVFISQEKSRNLNDKPPQAVVETIEGAKVISTMKKSLDKSNDVNTLKMLGVERPQEVCKGNQRENVIADLSSRNKKCVLNTQEQQKNVEIVNSKKCFNDVEPINVVESDTEHIYETIPEDSEAEPFYCSPYESSTYVNAVDTGSSSTSINGGAFHLQQRQKQRVAQWLGLCSAPSNTTLFPRKTIPMRNRNFAAVKEPLVERFTNKSDTVRSIVTVTTNGSSSSGGGGVDTSRLNNHQEELDNSSSAYNTGGSNASANQTQNDAIFLAKTLQEEALSTPLASRAIKRLQLSKDKEKINPKATVIGAQLLTKAYCATRTGCEEFSIPDTLIRMYPPLLTSQSADKKHSNKEPSPQICNKPQLTQADHLPRAVSMICPHFTAPNLRQYRFVSSQEVSALHQSTIINDTLKKTQLETGQLQQQQQPPMVWKVKRRPDGTRYIVRRPAVTVMTGTAPALAFSSRGRGQRNLEYAARNDATTTEDDTISEVKTGRYWSKEERKKHVERARERRLQQQQQVEQQMLEGTMCISEKMIARLQQHRKNRQKHQMLKIQHQDLQFGGSINHKMVSSQTKTCVTAIAPGTNCDSQPVLGIKQYPASVKTNSLSQQHQIILFPNDEITANAIPVDENDYSENCSSP